MTKLLVRMSSTRGRGESGLQKKNTHPTRDLLIAATIRLLETTGPDDLKVEVVLAESGVSSGSMYHHFRDLDDLINHAMIAQYSAVTDDYIHALTRAVYAATDKKTLETLLHAYAASIVAPERAAERAMRTQVMARAARDERFRALLLPEQARLLGATVDLARDLQAKGLLRPNLSPMAIAVFGMAYNVGLIVNDHTSEPADVKDLVTLISDFYSKVLLED
jgi:AcrR family transcriptional regulator